MPGEGVFRRPDLSEGRLVATERFYDAKGLK
jgi:hypothetical protein